MATATENFRQDGETICGDGEKDLEDSRQSTRPKAYVWHRTQGTARPYPVREGEPVDGSDTNNHSKPPCFLCYAPVPVYYLAGILEQNRFCESFGKIGCYGHDDGDGDGDGDGDIGTRRNILLFGVVANCLSFLLSVFAWLSLSLDFDHIAAAGFSKGLVFIPRADLPTSQIWIGLRAVAVRTFESQVLLNPTYVEGDSVLEFDSFCDYVDKGLSSYMDPDDCDSCNEASSGLITAVVIAALCTLPNIFTDILRMYPNYDLNCQKAFGSLVNLLSIVSSLYAFRIYATQCFRSFYKAESVVPLSASDSNVNATALQFVLESMQARDPSISFDADNPTLNIDFRWKAGNGLICIVLGTLLKFVDIGVMMMVSTPSISRSRKLQEEYEELYGQEKDEDDDDADADDDDDDDDDVSSPLERKIHDGADDDACNDPKNSNEKIIQNKNSLDSKLDKDNNMESDEMSM